MGGESHQFNNIRENYRLAVIALNRFGSREGLADGQFPSLGDDAVSADEQYQTGQQRRNAARLHGFVTDDSCSLLVI